MTESRKFNRRLALVGIPLLALMIFGISCDQSESTATTSTPVTTESTQSSTTTPETAIEPEPSQMPDEGTMTAPPDNMDGQMPAGGGQPPMASDNMSRPMSQPGGGMGMSFLPDMATLAATLGVTEQELEDAFAQAMEEMMADFQAPSENMTPEETSPEEMVPGEMPEGTPSEMPSMESLYARVAEILGIDQETLEAAISEMMTTIQEIIPQ